MRVCGGCTSCCTVLDVPELQAPAGMPCRFQGASGCGNYFKRPSVCRDWQCQWMADNDYSPPLLLDDERPDKIGLMVNIDQIEPVGTVLVVHELREGAVAQNEAMVYRIAERCPVLVRPANKGETR